MTASIIRFPESLYASSVYAEKPYIILPCNTPEINENGVIPNVTRVKAQLLVNAIVNPQTKDATLARFIPIIVEVNPFINLQSTDNLLVRVPALLFG